jgi:hypothetical protein
MKAKRLSRLRDRRKPADFCGMEFYSSRPIEIALNHNIPDGDSLNPSEINIVVWDDDYLWVDTTYYTVQSLTSFTQDLTLCEGTFEVVLTAKDSAGLILFQGDAELTVEEAGLYYLQYAPSP